MARRSQDGRTASRVLRGVAVATAIIVGLALAWSFAKLVPDFIFIDLGVYRGAVRFWLLDGGDIYDYRYDGPPLGFTYPPFAAILLSPLSVMSWPVAIGVSVTVNIAALVLLARWFVAPALRRWPVWLSTAVGACAVAFAEPGLATLSLGQINLVLVVLVCADLRALEKGSRWAGIGIGLAVAIKVTPVVFIGYLLISRRFRAAVTATATAVGAAAVAAILLPGPSLEYWTSALWQTERVGDLASTGNQSLSGVVARLDGSAIWWLIAVAVVVAYWWVRVRSQTVRTGMAMTGVLACLISPVTWVHHLVWLLPAAAVLLGRAMAVTGRQRWWRLGALAAGYAVLWSGLHWYGLGDVISSNADVWISLVLFLAVPVTSAASRIGLEQSDPAHHRRRGIRAATGLRSRPTTSRPPTAP
ncbi:MULTISPECIES: glycosyltransferase 87 family protein [Actinoplanes]|uniref:glycosyltransferase 87 family protein n=1 Tax=Actinoplanes TaxID=1865 RepID=UPI000697BBB8|nr:MULTISPECIES: glycosyltransferase 87 family protein [Actinoplanes]GLY05703.1 hypothetical protein Acsp01_60820 [Actinoplanes sp. NBRC 101535]